MSDSIRPDALLAAIVDVGRTLPTRTVADIADQLRELRSEASEQGVDAIVAGVAARAARDALREVVHTWRRTHADLAPETIAWGLLSAASVDAWHRAAQSMELVWTGPAPAGTTLRRTDQALLELIRNASSDLLIVTFAAYKVPALRTALEEARGRKVRLTFVVESPDVGEGKVSVDPLIGLGSDLGANVWIWPEARRERDAKGRHGTLHAKCALADSSHLLVSSANFTGDALAINMELGLLIEGGDAPGVVRAHFAELMRAGVLERRD